jgi:hypothetical protein
MQNDPKLEPPDSAVDANLGPSTHNRDEQKLWFDYIRTLNERRLQSAQRSGFTTYLLLAALAGIAYRFVPRLPLFLKASEDVRAAITIFLLEADLFCFSLVTLFVLANYCSEGTENRIIPEHRRRVTQVGLAILIILMAAFALAHIMSAWRFSFASLWVRRGLILLGLYWIANVTYAILKETRKIRESVVNKVPIPRFSASRSEPNLLYSSILSAFTTLLAIRHCLAFLLKV